MKISYRIVFFVIIISGLFLGWNLFGPISSTPEKKFFYIKTGSNYNDVQNELIKQHVLSSTFLFDIICKAIQYKEKVKPGRYEISGGTSLIGLIRKLKSGNQKEVRLVITKLRTKENLAQKIGSQFEADSQQVIRFLLNNDSLKAFEVDTNTVMSLIIPNSYLLWWNGSVGKIFSRLKTQHDYFWEGKRSAKAKRLGLNSNEVYTIASIVEEETNAQSDKGKIASVYINRLKKGMKLEADPTVKYAMRNFELKRILHGHLTFASPYNTYQNTGLPPGPICTPTISTIDAVLDAPATNYLFFVAKPDLSGYSNFSPDYSTHLINAKLYQQAINKLYQQED